MHLLILPTGKCREAAMLALEAEYLQRLRSSPWRVSVRELATATNAAAEAKIQLAEMQKLATPAVRIVLDERGAQVSSRSLADKLGAWQDEGTKAVAILIGGADGFDASVRDAADWVWSLGKLTLPHQLVRVVLAEQLYRAQTLLAGHPYHRD